MARKPIFMETTEISAAKTAGEITAKLIGFGAKSIAADYGAGGQVVAMRFILPTRFGDRLFELPVRTEAIFKILNGRRQGGYLQGQHREKDLAQAERVAWRQLLRWIEAQLGMVETGMAQAEEVFLPYLVSPGGQTFFQMFQEHGPKMLGAGS
jgi:hypothetical protein